jgi:hypothetical protein
MITGRFEEALEDYSHAYRLLAETSFGNVRQVLLLRELGRLEEADEALADARLRTGTDDWLAEILACLAGEVTPAQLLVSAASGDRQKLCEAYYYAGEMLRQEGKLAVARTMFQDCLNQDMYIDQRNFRDRLSEVELAEWRLAQIDEIAETAEGPEDGPPSAEDGD